MTKYFIGVVGAFLGALGGAWLMVAPFALAYQPAGAGWVNSTFVDFWTGLPLLVVSVAGLIMYILGLIEELKNRGVIERRIPASQQYNQPQDGQGSYGDRHPAGGEGPRQNGDVDQVLLPLVTAMLQDMKDRQSVRDLQTGSRDNATTRPVEREERRPQ